MGMRVAVIGCGYIGLPIALLAVNAGHEVVAFDSDRERVGRLESGFSHLADVTDSEVQCAVESGKLRPTEDPTDLDGFDIALICVPTPVDSGRPNLAAVRAAAGTLVAYLQPGATVVLESSTYPGTTTDVVVPVLESSGLRAGVDVGVGYSPERIDPGMSLARVQTVPKIVAGVDQVSTDRVADFYRGLVDTVVVAPDIRTAELAKLVENVFRLVNVSLVNELAQHATALGASIWDALALADTKGFGFLPFHPGPGAGGHCLPSDSRYLAWAIRAASGRAAELLETACQVNDSMSDYVAGRVVEGLAGRGGPPIAGACVVVLGVTYKAGIPDVRQSAALKVAYELARRGAEIVLVDPVVRDIPTVRPQLTRELATAAAAVVLLVAHASLDCALLRSATYVFDATGTVERAANVETL